MLVRELLPPLDRYRCRYVDDNYRALVVIVYQILRQGGDSGSHGHGIEGGVARSVAPHVVTSGGGAGGVGAAQSGGSGRAAEDAADP